MAGRIGRGRRRKYHQLSSSVFNKSFEGSRRWLTPWRHADKVKQASAGCISPNFPKSPEGTFHMPHMEIVSVPPQSAVGCKRSPSSSTACPGRVRLWLEHAQIRLFSLSIGLSPNHNCRDSNTFSMSMAFCGTRIQEQSSWCFDRARSRRRNKVSATPPPRSRHAVLSLVRDAHMGLCCSGFRSTTFVQGVRVTAHIHRYNQDCCGDHTYGKYRLLLVDD